MDAASWVEIVKVGGPVLLFACVLLWFTLRDKDRMAVELKEDKERVLQAFCRNTEAITRLTKALDERPCIGGGLAHGEFTGGKA